MMRRVQIALLALLLNCVGACAAQEYELGKHYQRAPSEIADNPLIQELAKETEAKGKVLVLEFFGYGCHWCYVVDPVVSAWQKKAPAYVDFQRVPVEFHPDWSAFTKVYYTAKELHILDKVHSAFFEAIQTNQITNTSEATLRQFFGSKGISAEDFNKMYHSFEVDRKQKWANSIVKAYRITAVPVLVVQGPKGIYVASMRMAGNEENLVKVLSYLVQMQHPTVNQKAQTQGINLKSRQ